MTKKRITMSEEELDRFHIIKKLESKEIKQAEAASKLGLSIRQIKRLVRRYKNQGNEGIIGGYRGGNRAFDDEFKQQVISTVKNKYPDFGPSFAAEKLAEINQLEINRETLRQWMIKEELWKGKRRNKARIHQSRARRPCYGELVQIDGSHHDWFEGRAAKCCLLVFIDDATSKLMELRFEESETTKGYFACVYNYIINHGIPLAFYSDKDSVFTVNTPSKDGLKGETQFGRAMKELKIEVILAHSPQAKGRVERANSTLQDRLIKEMRLRNISSIEEANEYMPEFIRRHNKKFGVKAAKEDNAHRAIGEDKLSKLKEILSIQSTRKLSKNLELSYHNLIYQIQRVGTGYSFRHASVSIYELVDGSVIIKKGTEYLKYKVIAKNIHEFKTADSKEVNGLVDKILEREKKVA